MPAGYLSLSFHGLALLKMREIQLGVPAVTDSEWRYTIPNLVVPARHGKFVVFTSERIIFRTAQFSSNRILHNDDPSLFISVNFKDFRMPDYTTVVLPFQASPDMFYANQMLRRLLAADPTAFERLF